MELCALKVNPHAVEDVLFLDDAGHFALIDVERLNDPPVVLTLRRHGCEIGEVRDIQIDVRPVDIPAAGLGQQIMEIGVAHQFFDLNLAHPLQMRLDPVQTRVVIPAHTDLLID